MNKVSLDFEVIESLIRENTRLEMEVIELRGKVNRLTYPPKEGVHWGFEKFLELLLVRTLKHRCDTTYTYDALNNYFRDLVVEAYPDNMVERIKLVRKVTGFGLQLAKAFVDGDNNLDKTVSS